MRVHLEVDLVSSVFIWIHFTVSASRLHIVAFAFWERIHKGHFSQDALQTSGVISHYFSPNQIASQVWLPLHKTHPAMFTATWLVDMHREQGNCVYLDMQGHDRHVKPQRHLQGGLTVIMYTLFLSPWITVPVETRLVHPQEPLSFFSDIWYLSFSASANNKWQSAETLCNWLLRTALNKIYILQ